MDDFVLRVGVAVSYAVYMSTTITIRTDDPLRKRLEELAAATGRSLSQVVREILQNAVEERSIGERAGHLKGTISLPRGPEQGWRRAIRERNWRP